MKVLITGADGFIGRNLQLRLREYPHLDVVTFTRAQAPEALASLVSGVDCVFHLAGVNRPKEPLEFVEGNVDLTRQLCAALTREFGKTNKHIPLIYSSSKQAALSNDYGATKHQAEKMLIECYGNSSREALHIFRLPNVFGKWCRPHYNSVVATFCHNISRDLPVHINNASAAMTLVYIDDVLDQFIDCMHGNAVKKDDQGYAVVTPEYSMTVGELETLIRSFRESRNTLEIERVGSGLKRALYATYVSYLPIEAFSYPVQKHEDPRGMFVEMLKTPDCGQFSFFTAYPGITRGGHYHHSKTEKFLVIKGHALFRFKHMQTDELYELKTSGQHPQIVETIPGWAHDITNIGEEDMVVMLWANEKFEKQRPDTISYPMGTVAGKNK
jgi:UDP-2-acetamido-2,6-beta-L-arabino-hexul-4-ose reductase